MNFLMKSSTILGKFNIFRDKAHSTTTTTTGGESPPVSCFCSHFRPVLRFGQLFGIVPLSISHDDDSDAVPELENKKPCKFVRKIISIPNLIFWIFLATYLQGLHFTVTVFTVLIAPFFEKTDYYAFISQICVTFANTTFILLHTRVKLSKLQRVFVQLGEIWDEIRGINPGFAFTKKFRRRIIFVLLWATISCGLYTSWFTYALTLECRPRNLGLLECFTLLEGFQKITYALMPFYQQGLPVLLCTLALISNSFHAELSKQLKIVLGGGGAQSQTSPLTRHRVSPSPVAKQILRMRLIHTRLCATGHLIGGYFGFISLTLCCTGIIIWIGGFYGLILNSENLLPPSEDPRIVAARAFYIIRYFEMYFALSTIVIIVIAGQVLQNSGSFCEDVIFESKLVGLDERAEHQVLVFIRNLRTSKRALKAANICSIGLNFLSSGIVHSFTYLIILFQFRTSHQQ